MTATGTGAAGRSAPALVLAMSGALLLGALGFQHLGGLHPCELCMWQRWPHLAAVVLAAAALVMPAARRPVALAAIAAIAISGGIGVLHTGVEQGWWQGPTTCASTAILPGDFTQAMLNAPVIRCDAIAWSFAGLSMAGWNAVISLLTAAYAASRLARRAPRQAAA